MRTSHDVLASFPPQERQIAGEDVCIVRLLNQSCWRGRKEGTRSVETQEAPSKRSTALLR